MTTIYPNGKPKSSSDQDMCLSHLRLNHRSATTKCTQPSPTSIHKHQIRSKPQSGCSFVVSNSFLTTLSGCSARLKRKCPNETVSTCRRNTKPRVRRGIPPGATVLWFHKLIYDSRRLHIRPLIGRTRAFNLLCFTFLVEFESTWRQPVG